jgi:hypothetical protein
MAVKTLNSEFSALNQVLLGRTGKNFENRHKPYARPLATIRKMKNIIKILVIGSFLISSCSNSNVEQKNTVNTSDLNSETESDKKEEAINGDKTDSEKYTHFESLPEYQPLTKTLELKTDSTIKIPVDSGDILFQGAPNLEVDISDYTYHGINENINFHFVSGSFWEHYEGYLVDKKTGKIDTIWTEPTFSTTDSLLVSKSMDYGLEYVPNGFQVWKLTKEGNWKKISEIDQLDWVPLKIKWANKNEFIVKTTGVTNYLENGPDIKQNFEFRRYQVSENNVAEMVYNIK